jgi:hypothetical protein
MSFKWPERESHYAVLRARLQSLRSIFPIGPRGETYCALFDDFLGNNEFGLAMQVLCDFLLESDVPSPNEAEFKEIALLHTLMEIQDDYLLRLRDKRQLSENSGSQLRHNA